MQGSGGIRAGWMMVAREHDSSSLGSGDVWDEMRAKQPGMSVQSNRSLADCFREGYSKVPMSA
jgi:hypothetical protein